VDHDRLAYLEQRSVDDREAAEDTFHAANNALFVMNVNLQLLTRHLTRGQECNHPEVQRWLSVLSQKLDEVALLNRKLLSGSASGEGPLYLVHSYISFRAAIQRAIDTYADVASEKRIGILWTLPQFPAIAVWTDGVAIGTVLDNLLSNAIKFSEPETEIEVVMTREGTDLVCAVCDQGPGLSSEEMAHVFDRGANLGPKPTAGESSSGFGLSIARDVVESLGGRIWCEAVEGKGSCFKFAIPIVAPPLAL
jgi:signal transduction histidine kinase